MNMFFIKKKEARQTRRVAGEELKLGEKKEKGRKRGEKGERNKRAA